MTATIAANTAPALHTSDLSLTANSATKNATADNNSSNRPKATLSTSYTNDL